MANSVLLLHCNGSDGSTTITDSSASAKTPSVVTSPAQIDTAQSVFGGTSLSLNGATADVRYADSTDWNFGTGDFTIDFWVRFTDVTRTETMICGGVPTTGKGWAIRHSSSNTPYMQISSTDSNNFTLSGGDVFANNTWYHLAFVRYGNNITFYKDGQAKGGNWNVTGKSVNSADTGLCVGSRLGNTWLSGWMDEIRVVNGEAKFTSNFDVPTGEYNESGVVSPSVSPSISPSVSPSPSSSPSNSPSTSPSPSVSPSSSPSVSPSPSISQSVSPSNSPSVSPSVSPSTSPSPSVSPSVSPSPSVSESVSPSFSPSPSSSPSPESPEVVNCGTVGVVTNSISTLSHLEGETVAILADGEVLNQQVVSSGSITFPAYYTQIHAGLPFISDLETLNVEIPIRQGTIQARRVKIGNVTFRLVDSRGGWVGGDDDSLYEAFPGAIEAKQGDVDDLYTGDIRVPLGDSYKGGGRLFFRQYDPLPVTIGAVVPEIAVGGT